MIESDRYLKRGANNGAGSSEKRQLLAERRWADRRKHWGQRCLSRCLNGWAQWSQLRQLPVLFPTISSFCYFSLILYPLKQKFLYFLNHRLRESLGLLSLQKKCTYTKIQCTVSEDAQIYAGPPCQESVGLNVGVGSPIFDRRIERKTKHHLSTFTFSSIFFSVK